MTAVVGFARPPRHLYEGAHALNVCRAEVGGALNPSSVRQQETEDGQSNRGNARTLVVSSGNPHLTQYRLAGS